VANKGKLNPVSYRTVERAAAPRLRRAGFPVEKIISGGQTGVDRAALDFALEHGIPRGGWCPRGRLAEDGVIERSYELRETPDAAYPQRTEWNVRDSDGTVIFSVAPELTGGSALTREAAVRYGKPWLRLSQEREGRAAVARLRQFLRRHRIRTLNVAGPRLSTEPGARAFASRVLEGLYRAGAGD
jgi:hypothetical protein